MARNQEKYKKLHYSEYHISNFVTAIVRPSGDKGDTDIECYMVSDMCQSLERDGIFAESKDIKQIHIREAMGNEVIPTVFMESKPVTTLDPIFFIVNVYITNNNIK